MRKRPPKEWVIVSFVCKAHGLEERLRVRVHRRENFPAQLASLEKFDEKRGGREKAPRVICGSAASHKTLFDAVRPYIEPFASGEIRFRYFLEERI